jgi:hypothetical protein
MATDIVSIDGRVFPVHNGQALSWSLGCYSSYNDEKAGFARMRAVIQAMRIHRPEQLRKERFEMLKASFNAMFGHNARKVLEVIDAEAPEASRTIFDL